MHITAISISSRKGMRKNNVLSARLLAGHGLENDAHAGIWHRQVSLLAEESIASMRAKGLSVVAGNFAENITTSGLLLTSLTVGQHLQLGSCEVIVSQLGKVCHKPCAIFHQAGDCVMPREGIFAMVLTGGPLAVGDPITVLPERSPSLAVVLSPATEQQYGDKLRQTVQARFQPAVLRLDVLNQKEDNLPAVLENLHNQQQVTQILIVDPDGRHQVQMSAAKDPAPHRTLYCRSLAEISGLPVSAVDR